MNFFQFKTSEQDLLDGIRSGGLDRLKTENKLYDNYRYLIKDGLRKHRLNDEDASMAYSDTVMTVIKHICNGRFEARSKLKTYIHQIFYNKCVDAIRKNSTKEKYEVNFDEILYPLPDHSRSALTELILKQDHDKLKRLLSTLGERCQELLSRWADGFSDKENAGKYGYNTAHVAQTTRLRCLDKLKEMYRQ